MLATEIAGAGGLFKPPHRPDAPFQVLVTN
jgi:hypothetical protein